MSSFDVGDCVYTFSVHGTVYSGLIVGTYVEDQAEVIKLKDHRGEITYASDDCVYATKEQAINAALKWQIDNIMNEIAELDIKRRTLSGKLAKLEQKLKGQDVGGTEAETQG